MGAPLITFLSDYGRDDEFVAVCHGVIASRCPAARVLDITHAIAPQDVRAGALVLRDALPYIPAGVHLAVVDPDVGARGERARRAVALRTAVDERLLVGPDNGLLLPAAELFGGVAQAVELSASPVRLRPSSTFDGRDVFAPVAAALAGGASLEELGSPLPAGELVALELPVAWIDDGALFAHVLRVDRFGNVNLDAAPSLLDRLGVERGATLALELAGGIFTAALGATFADVAAGELLLHEDSTRRLALAVNRGSAVARLGLAPGDELRIRPA
jgi:S-adenosylmethionine hydrolase